MMGNRTVSDEELSMALDYLEAIGMNVEQLRIQIRELSDRVTELEIKSSHIDWSE